MFAHVQNDRSSYTRDVLISRDSKRISALDGLRGIAILMVLMVHLVAVRAFPLQSHVMRVLGALMWSGWSGVDLFFVLSGFLITGILIDSRTSPGYFSVFYIRRVLRIFPLYYLAVTTMIVVASLISIRYRSVTLDYPSSAGWVSYLLYYQNCWMPVMEPGRGLSLVCEMSGRTNK